MATATLRPNGDGTYDGDWTLTGGTAGQAYTTIDESSTDDADYISNNDTSSPYQRQSVTLSDMPEEASSISNVTLFFRSRSASGGTSARIVPFIRSGGSDQDSSEITTTTTVTEYSWDITGLVSWTTALLNALEVGWRRNATGSNTLRVTQAWVVVTYTAGQSVVPGGIASLEAFGSATIARGAVSIAPGSVTSLEAFGTARIVSVVAPAAIASLEAFGSHTVDESATTQTITPSNVIDVMADNILLTADLISFWRFAEPTGTVMIDAFGNANGTYHGAPSLDQPALYPYSGSPDRSVEFNGTSQYAVIDGSEGDFVFLDDAPFTVLLAVRLNTVIGPAGALVDKREDNSGLDGWVIIQSGEEIALEVWDSGSLVARAAVADLAVDTTYLLVFTGGSTEITAYLDGSAVDGDTRASFQNAAVPLTIGRYADGSTDFFDGTIDELAIFDRALDAGEILTLAGDFVTSTLEEGGIVSREWFGEPQINLILRPVIDAYAVAVLGTPNLDAYWRLAEPSGTTAADSSGNGYTGTYTDGPSLGQDSLLTAYPNEDKSIVLFTSDNDRVVVGGNFFNFNGTLPFTVMFLIRLSVDDVISTIIDRTDRDPDWNGWAVRQDNDAIVFEIYDNNSLTASLAISGLSPASTYHVTFTVSATEINAYLDGSLTGSPETRASIPASVANLTIGAQTDNTDHFEGQIDEVSLFARALDAEEVIAIYEASVFLDNAYGGIASLEAFGLPDVGLTVHPASIASLEAFGAASVAPGAVIVAPTGIGSLEAFGAAQVNLALILAGIASLEAFGTHTVARGAVSILPTGIASLEAFGSHALTTGVVLITPAGVASLESFGSPIVNIEGGNQTIIAIALASLEAFGSHALARGGVIILPTGIASLEAFGTAIIAHGAVTIGPSGVASLEAFGSHTVTQGAISIVTTGIGSLEAFGAHVVATGAVSISPSGIASLEAFGSPSVVLVITPTGISTLEAFGAPTVIAGEFILLPNGIGSLEAFGIPHIDGGVIIVITTPTQVRLIDGGGRGVEIVDAGVRGALLIDDGRRFIRIVR